jgi:Fe2+ or Zn2+ uptake regulation protein
MTKRDAHAEAAVLMKQASQRYTSVRREIVEVMSKSSTPLTMSDLLGKLPKVPQSSLYRNLAVLEQAGVAVRVKTSGDTGRYELSERLAGHHHHLVCSRCGSMKDIVVPSNVEKRLDDSLRALATSEGYVMQHHRLDVIGVCKKCR